MSARAFWIAGSLCLASTAGLAQSSSRTVLGLDTCFKLVRVAEQNCSTSANDAAQRQECLQTARKVQLECLELAGVQAPAPVDRPQMAAGTVPSVGTAGSVPPVVAAAPPSPPTPAAGVAADQKEIEPARTMAAAPSAQSAPTPSPNPTAAPAPASSGTQGSRWTVSETTSPVDYSPLVTATIAAQSGTKDAPTALVVRCRGRGTELGLRLQRPLRTSRGGEVQVAYQINDQPMVKLRWTSSAEGKTASYRDDAVALLQSFSEGGQLKIAVSDASGGTNEATFQLAGWNAIRDKIAAACLWTSTAGKSSERR